MGVVLEWLFSNIVYPLIILSILIFILTSVSIIVFSAGRDGSIIRRMTGALLPAILLVFYVVSDSTGEGLTTALQGVSTLLAFGIGAGAGLVIIECGRYFSGRDSEIGPALYCMLLSFVGVFLIYAVMKGVLDRIHYMLLGLVIAGAVDIIFRGVPYIKKSRETEISA